MRKSVDLLRQRGIQPTAQRVAVADYVLHTDEHPSADLVLKRVQQKCPYISRATVYNTLNLFVDKGLLRSFHLAENHVVFDSNTAIHHHFIDTESGAIHDIPWDQINVCDVETLKNFVVHDYQVVMHGVRKPPKRSNRN